jgi:hypothetical protein
LNWLKYQKKKNWRAKPEYPRSRDVGVGHDRRLARPLQGREAARVHARVAERAALQVQVVVGTEARDVLRRRRPAHHLRPVPSRDRAFERDGWVAEHRLHAGRLVLLLGGIARRIVLDAHHRDRRVIVGQALRRAQRLGAPGEARKHEEQGGRRDQ